MNNAETRRVRVVKSKVSTRSNTVDPKELEHQKEAFREARKARELERLRKLRDKRLQNSAEAAGDGHLSTSTSQWSASFQSKILASNKPTASVKAPKIQSTAQVQPSFSKKALIPPAHRTAEQAHQSASLQSKKLPSDKSTASVKPPKIQSAALLRPSVSKKAPIPPARRTTGQAHQSASFQSKKLQSNKSTATVKAPTLQSTAQMEPSVSRRAPIPPAHRTAGQAHQSASFQSKKLPSNKSTVSVKAPTIQSTTQMQTTVPKKAPTTANRAAGRNKRRSSGVLASKVISSRQRKQTNPPRKLQDRADHKSRPMLLIRQTKTSWLRLLQADPRLENDVNLTGLQTNQSHSSVAHNLNKSTASKETVENNIKNHLDKSETDGKKVCFAVEAQNHQTPSRIPRRKASFFSPVPQTPSGTPKPVVLRENLSNWLERKGLSWDSFRHLRCFGVNGPLGVKRPQTPFRRVIQSASKLKAIPESAESTSIEDFGLAAAPEMEDSVLNTTYTMEDEDKENCEWSPSSDFLKTSNPVNVERADGVSDSSVSDDFAKDHDKACGVLSELHQLIKEGYPSEQCELWVRAIRRRFPQCGDEAVYWECLASLEESRGDLHSAMSCYERAVLQGAEDSVQKSLEELRSKLAALNIVDVSKVEENERENGDTLIRRRQSSLLDSSNIIRSSTIQFAVQEKTQSNQKRLRNSTDDSSMLVTATPVRRSTRSTASPFQKSETYGIKCVRSLDLLEPDVRRSLVFHSNAALEPRE